MALEFKKDYEAIKTADMSPFIEALGKNPDMAKNMMKGLFAPIGALGAGLKGGYDWTRRQIEGGLDSTTEVTDEIIPEEEDEDVNFIQAAWNKLTTPHTGPRVTTEDIVPQFKRPDSDPSRFGRPRAYFGETDENLSQFITNPNAPDSSFLQDDHRTLLQRAWMGSRMGGGQGHIFPNLFNRGDK